MGRESVFVWLFEVFPSMKLRTYDKRILRVDHILSSIL